MDSHNIFFPAGFLTSTANLLQWLLEKQPMGFLPASMVLWQVAGSLMLMYEASLAAAGGAGTASSPHAADLPLILCKLAPLNQQFLALLTRHRQPQWPAVYQRHVPSIVQVLLVWQESVLRLAGTLIDGQRETAQPQASGAGGGGGRGAAAEGGGGASGKDREQQQQGQALPAVSNEGLLMPIAVRLLAGSPALWAAAWAQLAAFCQGMYTWQGGKLAEAQPSSSSSSKGSSSSGSSSSKSTGGRSSTIAGSSDFAGMFASLQLFPDHEQVAAVFDPGEISARLEELSIPAKGRPLSGADLSRTVYGGFVAPSAFLDSVLIFQGWCGGASVGHGTSSRDNSSGRSSSGRSDSSGSSGGGSSEGKDRGGSRSNANTRAAESISRTSTGSSSGECSSCSGGSIWGRGGVGPAAALQLVLEAAALLGVAGGRREATVAVRFLCTIAKNCSIGPRKCLLSTRGGLVLDVLTAVARSNPGFIDIVRNLINILLDDAREGALSWDGTSNLLQPCRNLCFSTGAPPVVLLFGRRLAAVNTVVCMPCNSAVC